MKKYIKTIGSIFVILALLIMDISINYAKGNNQKIYKEEFVDKSVATYEESTDANVSEEENIELQAVIGEIAIPEEEQKVVDKIMEEYKSWFTDKQAEVIDFDVVEKDLIYLKSLYPDWSYEQLWEKLLQIDSEEEAEQLFYGLPTDENETAIQTSEETELMMVNSTLSEETTQEKFLINSEFEKETLYFNILTKNKVTGTTKTNVFAAVISSYTKVIPGLKQTRTKNGMCKTMIPQGICVVGNYVLISAYDWKDVYKSVIYIVERKTLSLQTTIAMNHKAHVGGITYDGNNGNLWVCDSDNEQKHMRAYQVNIEALVRKGKYVELTSMATYITINNTPSFCTVYKGRLWVGTFSKVSPTYSIIVGYDLMGNDGLELKQAFELTGFSMYLQGMDFYNINGIDYLAISASWGRENNSNIYVYGLNGINVQEMTGTRNISSYIKKELVIPSMSQEIVHYGSKMYIIYESGSHRYRDGDNRGVSKNPCDRITATTPSFIYQ